MNLPADLITIILEYRGYLSYIHLVFGRYNKIKKNSIENLQLHSAGDETIDLSHDDCLKNLSVFRDMTILNLAGNHLTDISIIPVLPNLETLRVAQNLLKSIGNLGRFPKLKNLYVDHNELTNLSCLVDVPDLVSLDISKMRTTVDISTMPSLQNIKNLHLYHTKIIGRFPFLPCLRDLEYGYPGDFDISAILSLVHLQVINLSIFTITNVHLFSELPCLERIFLIIETLEFLPEFPLMPLLKNLSIHRLSHSVDISPPVSLKLPSFPMIIGLRVAGFKISDLSEFSLMPELISLRLTMCDIENISDFPLFPKLEDLDLYHNKIKDINRLRLLPSLIILNMSVNPIDNLDIFIGFPKLYKLQLDQILIDISLEMRTKFIRDYNIQITSSRIWY